MAKNIQFKWNRPVPDIVERSTGGREALRFLATTWHRMYDKFVPMRTGNLAHDSVSYDVRDDEALIRHMAPYAGKMYYGDTYKFSRDKHPLASARWHEVAKSAGQADNLAREYQAYLKRGGGGG